VVVVMGGNDRGREGDEVVDRGLFVEGGKGVGR
jgi:hypothetical protein